MLSLVFTLSFSHYHEGKVTFSHCSHRLPFFENELVSWNLLKSVLRAIQTIRWSGTCKEKGHVFTVPFALKVNKVLNGDFHILEEISRCSDEVNRAGRIVALGQDELAIVAWPDSEIHFLSCSHCSRWNIDDHSNILLSDI